MITEERQRAEGSPEDKISSLCMKKDKVDKGNEEAQETNAPCLISCTTALLRKSQLKKLIIT
jgi:ligand-binding sensor protein